MLEGLDAVVFFGLRGVGPIRVFQQISSGVLGRAAFTGGLKTALLGVAFHFVVATAIAAIYYGVSRKVAILTRHPAACGIGYGILVYACMNLVVLPFSAASHGPPTLPCCERVLIHALVSACRARSLPGGDSGRPRTELNAPASAGRFPGPAPVTAR